MTQRPQRNQREPEPAGGTAHTAIRGAETYGTFGQRAAAERPATCGRAERWSSLQPLAAAAQDEPRRGLEPQHAIDGARQLERALRRDSVDHLEDVGRLGVEVGRVVLGDKDEPTVASNAPTYRSRLVTASNVQPPSSETKPTPSLTTKIWSPPALATEGASSFLSHREGQT